MLVLDSVHPEKPGAKWVSGVVVAPVICNCDVIMVIVSAMSQIYFNQLQTT